MFMFFQKLALFSESESAQLTDILSVLRQNSYHIKRPKLHMYVNNKRISREKNLFYL